MKTALFALYVSAVLLFSAFARAEMAMPFSVAEMDAPSKVYVEDVRVVDPANLDIRIFGRLPNPCTKHPNVKMVQSSEQPGVLLIQLTSPTQIGICIQPVKGFAVTHNLPELTQNSEVYIEPSLSYVVKVDGSDLELNIQGADLMRVPGFYAQ